jgi:electron transport complex protein RnfB
MLDEIWFPQIDKELCTGCGDCIATCSPGALDLVDDSAVLKEPDVCNYCGECEAICPVEALALPYQILLASSE